MRHLRQLILLGLLSVLLATACLGQRRGKTRPDTKGRRTPVVRTEVVLAPEVSRNVGLARVSYNSYRDETSVLLDLPVIVPIARPTADEPFDIFNLQAVFSSPGRKLLKPDAVLLSLLAYDKKPVFRAAPSFMLKADGKQFTLSKLRKQSEVYAGVPRQIIGGEAGFADFEQIANSSKAEIHVGPHVLRLEDKHLEAMRDMIKALDAP